MNDLISQETTLALFFQKEWIHGNLTLLEDSYNASLPTSKFAISLHVLIQTI